MKRLYARLPRWLFVAFVLLTVCYYGSAQLFSWPVPLSDETVWTVPLFKGVATSSFTLTLPISGWTNSVIGMLFVFTGWMVLKALSRRMYRFSGGSERNRVLRRFQLQNLWVIACLSALVALIFFYLAGAYFSVSIVIFSATAVGMVIGTRPLSPTFSWTDAWYVAFISSFWFSSVAGLGFALAAGWMVGASLVMGLVFLQAYASCVVSLLMMVLTGLVSSAILWARSTSASRREAIF